MNSTSAAGDSASAAAFGLVDNCVFGLFLCVSLAVGVYHACHHSHKPGGATDEFLMGDRRMPIVPTALSLFATFMSGITLLGMPAEIYARGLLFLVYYFSADLAMILVAVFMIPVVRRMKTVGPLQIPVLAVSVYAYFELRFGARPLRVLAASLFMVYACLYMAVVLYGPALALSAVTNLPLWPWIIMIGAVCTFYTAIGGLKAVVWTDTLQAAFLYLGVIVMIVKGTSDAGGIGRVFRVASEYGRLQVLTNWDPSPLQHNSMWISVLGGASFGLVQFGMSQLAVQRYLSLSSTRNAQLVVWLAIPCFMLLSAVVALVGLIMLAYFVDDCDPLDRGVKPDQLVVVFAIKTLGSIPGFPGLFLACLFSSTLSTFSSGMNSQAAVLWEDFLSPYLSHRLSDGQTARLNKLLVLGFGLLATGMAFASGPIGGIIKTCFSLLGSVTGPLVGLFILGLALPQTHARPCYIALLAGVAFNVALTYGAYSQQPYRHYRLPANDSCGEWDKLPNWTHPMATVGRYGDPSVWAPFRVSAYLFSFTGLLAVVLVGSVLTLVLPAPKPVISEQERWRRAQLNWFGYRRHRHQVADASIGLVPRSMTHKPDTQHVEMVEPKS